MINSLRNFIVLIAGILFCFIFRYIETKHDMINIIENSQTTQVQANSDAIWTFRSGSSLKRSKRTFLAYGMGGVVKLVLGVTLPIILASPKRSLRVFYNIQLQYVPPPDPIYWWSFLNSTTFESRYMRSVHLQMPYDKSRSLVYEYLENIFRKYNVDDVGVGNQECLQRLICDFSRSPLSVDLSDPVYFISHKILNAIFIPVKPNIKRCYWEAHEAGRYGAHCKKTFSRCSLSGEILNKFIRFI